MKLKLSIRKVLQILFCMCAIVGAAGILSTAFSDSVYGGIADVLIIVINLGLITISILQLGNKFHKLLFIFDFICFCGLVYFSPTFLDNPENIFTLLIVNGGFWAWLTYVGIKYLFSLLLLPFKILGFIFKKSDRKKGALTGTKWICVNCEESSNGKIHYCGQKIITFKNGTPSPISMKGCLFSTDGKHNFVPVGSERDINSSVKNVIEWIGLFIGFAAGIGCMIMKFFN